MKAKHVGIHANRLSREPSEAAFARAWQKMNAQSAVLGHMLSTTNEPVRLTQEQAQVAATVVQWLGSEMGMCMICEVAEASPEVRRRLESVTERRMKPGEQPRMFEKFIFPVIKNMPGISSLTSSLASVQSVEAAKPGLSFEFKLAKPERPRHPKWEAWTPRPDIHYRWTGTVAQLADEFYADVRYHSDGPDEANFAENAKARFLKWASVWRPGDEVAEFRTSPASWAALAGRAGYAILRGDNVVSAYVTVLS